MAVHSVELDSPNGLTATPGHGPLQPCRAAGHMELVVMQARTLAAAAEAIHIVRGRGTVVLNCGAMPAELARRLLDVVQGGLCAIDGALEPIGADVVLLRPAQSQIRG
jgi:FtsZ-interacting cell division protein YlmF